MTRVPDIIPVTDLRDEAASMLKKLRKSARPVVVTQRGRAAAVMMSIEAYEQVEHEREILRALLRGEREIAAGKGHEMSDVMAEADAILSETRK